MSRVVVRVGLADDGERHMAVCQTGSCQWKSAAHVVKAGATEEASWHRETHRRENEQAADRRRLAEKAVVHGHFKPTATDAWVTCSACPVRVHATFCAWAKPHDVERALIDAVVEHLRDDCKGGRR
jgi:ferredoxin